MSGRQLNSRTPSIRARRSLSVAPSVQEGGKGILAKIVAARPNDRPAERPHDSQCGAVLVEGCNNSVMGSRDAARSNHRFAMLIYVETDSNLRS